ncbi:hypothetical protein VPNG_04310 [Cytospora leucostoma]|uniref:Uncharacterized protein n=1 Tax=Cytospora leucostoma TaxID=1230097 RepID=A0A423XE68_9PEZI|nr:hypothetical protein VPNG_04310 [Cytospora leucostoma]
MVRSRPSVVVIAEADPAIFPVVILGDVYNRVGSRGSLPIRGGRVFCIHVHLMDGSGQFGNLVHSLVIAHEALGAHVLRKGEGLNELLYAHEAAGVAVAVDTLNIGGDGGEERRHLEEA